MRNLIAAIFLASLLAPAPARAGRDAEAEALAARASSTVDEHCSDAAQADVTLAAESVARVSTVWAEVSKALEDSRKVYLLYWRGVLGQCLNQEEKALDDFEEFLRARGGSMSWASLVDDAERRIRVLKRKLGVRPDPPPGAPGFVVGAALAGGAAASGGLSGWQWSEALATMDALAAGEHVGGDAAAYQTAGDSAATTSHVLAGTAAGLGAAAAISIVIGATRPPKGARTAHTVVPVLVPTEGGAVAGLAGRW